MNIGIVPGAFSLIYFTADPLKAKQAFGAGVEAILVDCENKDKEQRQNGYNTEINYNRPKDIAKMRQACPDGTILCRVNSARTETNAADINMAFDCGANGIVLPLVESKQDVEETLRIIDGRGALIAMIETETGYRNIDEIVHSSIDAIYIGLNDFSISRGGTPLFQPLIDGTIEEIIAKSPVPVGVGGVTDPLFGSPIRSHTIIKEYQRLNVKFSILRRSFEKAIQDDSMQNVITRIKEAYTASANRDTETALAHALDFKRVIQQQEQMEASNV